MMRRMKFKLLALAVVLVSTAIPSRPVVAAQTPLVCGPSCSDFCIGCGVCQWQACFNGCYDSDGTYWRWYIVCGS